MSLPVRYITKIRAQSARHDAVHIHTCLLLVLLAVQLQLQQQQRAYMDDGLTQWSAACRGVWP